VIFSYFAAQSLSQCARAWGIIRLWTSVLCISRNILLWWILRLMFSGTWLSAVCRCYHSFEDTCYWHLQVSPRHLYSIHLFMKVYCHWCAAVCPAGETPTAGCLVHRAVTHRTPWAPLPASLQLIQCTTRTYQLSGKGETPYISCDYKERWLWNMSLHW
jgi:hypothetical protein